MKEENQPYTEEDMGILGVPAFTARFTRWLKSNNHQEKIGQKDTEAKHNVAFRIEEENHEQLYGIFKDICKHYKIRITQEQEMALYLHNMIMPCLYKLAEMDGSEYKESAKKQIEQLTKELNLLIEQNETKIILEKNKETSSNQKNELLTFSHPIQ